MRKLILKCGFSPGDIVMMTAAVRDLHHFYPGQFLTDVRTHCPALWEHNPHLTTLAEADPDVELIDCAYPLIDRCNELPYHCLHGYIHFLNQRLGLTIAPTAFKGDIHLSDQEKSWYSQVHELTRKDIPFWIVAAGGKYDVTIKWWDSARYQQVVDHFRGKIQFVQVGEFDHYHPRLKGVIDLRGQTDLRQLVRLVYHAQGVLCPVTALMHLAAAVEVKPGRPDPRPCVVVAGGREPAHWEAYPGHQFIHTIGLLPCCAAGGCWRDRTRPLGDGDPRDQAEHLCPEVLGSLPRCMAMITAGDVIRRIELYFKGGQAHFLDPVQARVARRGVRAARLHDYEDQPLNLHSAPAALAARVRELPAYPGGFTGRGIVICGGGVKYLPGAWIAIRMLRRLGCALPIQLWHLGPVEVDSRMKGLLRTLGVECVDALRLRRRHPARRLQGWELKAYAVLHCRFREVLYLDADNLPVVNPEFLFETAPFRRTGAVFWPDLGRFKKTQVIWDNCGLARPPGPEFESGQMLLDKRRCWKALCLALWFNEHSDFYYQYLLGDKETFHLAFRKLGRPFAMPRTPVRRLAGTMCQHDFRGRRVFQHRNSDKWNLELRNRRVSGFWFEDQCRTFLRELQSKWDGGMSRYWRAVRRPVAALTRPVHIHACMISCPTRNRVRARTLKLLAATDWGRRPVHVEMDPCQLPTAEERQTRTSYLALLHGLQTRADYLLFLEDDLEFNRWFYHNLCAWQPLRERRITLAGLYNPSLNVLACDVRRHAVAVAPGAIFGSQAFLLSRAAAKHLVRNWERVEGKQDIKMSRLAGELGRPIFYHTPSLVQHCGIKSVWGGPFHQAFDFDRHWKNTGAP